MSTLARGGQVGSIAWKGEEKVKLFDWFCMLHYDNFEKKPNPIKMTQNIVTQDLEEGTRYEYFKSCPKCRQIVKEGEYVRETDVASSETS